MLLIEVYPAWCRLGFWPGDEDAIPDAKHPGKARKILRGKARSPPGVFPGFLGPEAHKLSVTPAKLAEVVFFSKLAISPKWVQGPWPLVQVHEGRRGPRPVVSFVAFLPFIKRLLSF